MDRSIAEGGGPAANPVNRHGQASSRAQRREWRTALTKVEPNRILVRGYPVDELMGRITFAEAVYLLFVGELPSPQIGRLVEALLVSSIDHGTTPPSTIASRNVATSGASMQASLAAGVLAFGPYHGGDIENGMRFLEDGVALVRNGMSYELAARKLVERYRERHEPIPGFGHRIHTHDPRAVRLFQMALELDLDGDHMQVVRAVERALNEGRGPGEPHIPVNVDGAISAVCGDLGLDMSVGYALFMISRVPGLVAQAHEEQTRERRMRAIDATAAQYDGPSERPLREARK